MFDAGSTGSRIHVYKFHKDSSGQLILDDELFQQVKPGLSSYPDDIEGAVSSINSLLEAAKQYIDPAYQNKNTPLALKASAGLRILGAEKSEPILKAVNKLLNNSPFHQVWEPEIMGGDKEAVYSWVTLNYLAKILGNPKKSLQDTYGTLDLGGGSTQIAFHPTDFKTKQSAPEGYLVSEKAFNNQIDVYLHSYLGLGLMSARQAVLDSLKSTVEGSDAVNSACFDSKFSESWENARVHYQIQGTGLSFNSCYTAVSNMIKNSNIHQADEIKTKQFYAFSYYFDRAVEVGLITEDGGEIKVEEFKQAAHQICDSSSFSSIHDSENKEWLCLDLNIIYSLLVDGFGFEDANVLKLYKKIDGIETQWSLGATFAIFSEN